MEFFCNKKFLSETDLITWSGKDISWPSTVSLILLVQ